MCPTAAVPAAAGALFHHQLRAQLHAVLATLEEQEARVIAMRFGLAGGGATSLGAVASAFGTTRECIRRIEVAAMKKLRDPSRSNLLRQYHCDFEGTRPGGGVKTASECAAEPAPAPDA